MCLACGRDAAVGELVGAVIAWCIGVPTNPVPLDVVFLRESVQFLPQVGILHRLALSGLPAIFFPDVDPSLDAVSHVLRVGIDVDRTAALEALERTDHGGKFHAVIGGVRLATEDLELAAAILQHRAPATGPWVALACAVGVNDDRRRPAHSTTSAYWRACRAADA